MAKANLRVTRDLKAPDGAGVHHRVLCMTGENKGISYYLRDKRFVMGRGKSSDIQILDTNCSREHVELTFVKKQYVLTDLGSHNGVVINDLKVMQHALVDGDRIIIGKTVYKYNKYTNEENSLVTNNDNPLVKEGEESEETSEPEKDSKKKILYGALILILIFVFLDEGPTVVKTEKKVHHKEKNIDDKFTRMLKKKVKIEDAMHVKKVNIIIGRGLREMREKNYFRAIEEFEVARILNPSSGTVSYYISKSKQYLDEDISKFFIKSRREIDALKYEDAKGSYCAIIQLLRNYPDDERYKKAETQIKELEKVLGMLEGEIACLRDIKK